MVTSRNKILMNGWSCKDLHANTALHDLAMQLDAVVMATRCCAIAQRTLNPKHTRKMPQIISLK